MRDNTFSKKVFIKTVSDNLKNKYRKTIDDATQQELYQAVSEAVKDVIMDEWIATQRVMDKDDPKVVYYMSMEFLMGRALGNNLINLSAYKEVKEALNEIGVDINAIEDQEPDPALGNGGLGRLAACFMDSLATLGYPAYGCGIRYRYGMFKQQISDGFQIEVPDNWLKDGYPFELRRPEYCYEVKFGGYVQESTDENGELHFEQKDYQSVLAVPYDMPIVGYDNNVVNSLMIWDAEPKNGFSLESFDHLGAMQSLLEHDIKPNILSGVSAGALAGVFYADGNEPHKVLDYFAGHKFQDLTKLVIPKVGLFELGEFIDFLKSNLKSKKLEELQIPLIITATDLDHGRLVHFHKGDIAERVAASCCMPVLFAPVNIDGTHYVDGGLLMNLPVSTLRRICEKVIAVNVSPLMATKYKMNIVSIALRSYNFMFRSNSFPEREKADLLIEPYNLEGYSNTELEKAEEIFMQGYNTTNDILERLLIDKGSIWKE